ncbi:MAG: hypothetical protein KAR08_12150, partial [Candidatus Heimdallarchaeota archaeon]|nr:hypothetical protein [Candidatus Heimdallarchaeota archaeon]
MNFLKKLFVQLPTSKEINLKPGKYTGTMTFDEKSNIVKYFLKHIVGNYCVYGDYILLLEEDKLSDEFQYDDVKKGFEIDTTPKDYNLSDLKITDNKQYDCIFGINYINNELNIFNSFEDIDRLLGDNGICFFAIKDDGFYDEDQIITIAKEFDL